MRQAKGEDGERISTSTMMPEQQIDQWRGEKNQPRDRIQEIKHGVEIAEPLSEIAASGG